MKNRTEHRTLNTEHRNGGFSIIELSIVLTIIAMIVATSLSVGASRIEAARAQSTQERMDFIMKAIQLYVNRFGYVPCPADNSLPVTDGNFGRGGGSGNSATGCTDSNSSFTNTSVPTHEIHTGGVPWMHLNISPAITIDGWNRRFTYAVDEQLTWADGDPTNGGWDDPATTTDGEIRITRSSGGTNITANAAVVLISHGTNGHGAFPGKGGTRLDKGCTTDVDEDENTDLGVGVGCPAVNDEFVQKFRTSTYDDMVEYRTKWQLD